MNKLVSSISILVFLASVASPQAGRSHRHCKPSKSKSVQSKKVPKPARSIVGLDLRFATPDRDGGIWITGTAWFLRGLMVNDHNGQIQAFTVPGVGNISHPLFVTRDIGWMVDVRSLYRTEDAGRSWQKVEIANRLDVRAFYFSDSNNGWVTGWNGALYHTTDAGQTWRKQETGLNYEFDEVVFIDSLHGWINGSKSHGNLRWSRALLRTNDGGDSWEVLNNVDSTSQRSVSSLTFVDPNKGWGIDSLNNIVHTIDGGKTWTVQQPSQQASWKSLFFLNEKEGWASGRGILHTSDGGQTWNHQLVTDQTDRYYLEQIVFIDNKHGWALGGNRALRTTDGGMTWRPISDDDWKTRIPSYQMLRESSSKPGGW